MDKRVNDLLADILEMNPEELDKLDDNADLRTYSLNSLNAIEFIVGMEEILGIQVSNEDLLIENCSTKHKVEQLYNKYKKNIC